MGNKKIKTEYILTAISLMVVVVMVLACLELPETVVTSLNSQLVVDGMGSRWLLIILPSIAFVFNVVNLILSRFKFSEKTKRVLYIIANVLTIVFLYMNVLRLDIASQNFVLGQQVDFPLLAAVFFPVGLLVALGGSKLFKILTRFNISESVIHEKYNTKILKLVVIMLGFALALSCIVDFIFKTNLIPLIVFIVGFVSIAVIMLLIVLAVQKTNKESDMA